MTVTETDRPATERAVRTRPRLKQRYRDGIAELAFLQDHGVLGEEEAVR